MEFYLFSLFNVFEQYHFQVTDVIWLSVLSVIVITLCSNIIFSLGFKFKKPKNLVGEVYNDFVGGTCVDDNKKINIGINIPAYQEEDVIIETVRSALSADYPLGDKEIIVVTDGSPDQTVPRLIKQFDMILDDNQEPVVDMFDTSAVKGVYRSRKYPFLRVIYKDNEGKAKALNTGLAYFSDNISFTLHIDADTLLRDDALIRLVEKQLANPEYIAIAGVVTPYIPSRLKGCNKFHSLMMKLLVSIQQVEYLTAFHVGRAGHAFHNSILIVSGAFGLFNRKTLIDMGGYRCGLGEDMDVTLRIQDGYLRKSNGGILFQPQATCYTAVPLTLRELFGQRIRWFKGLLENLIFYRHLLKPNKLGLVYLEYLILETILPILLPFGLVFLCLNLQSLEYKIPLYSFIVVIALSMLKNIIALFMERSYRGVNWLLILCIPLLPITAIINSLWKIYAALTYRNKEWGKIAKRFE